MQPGPASGFSSVAALNRRKRDFFMTVMKVIKSLTRRKDKAEERKKLKRGTEERQKA